MHLVALAPLRFFLNLEFSNSTADCQLTSNFPYPLLLYIVRVFLLVLLLAELGGA